jgi:hypothetical protein
VAKIRQTTNGKTNNKNIKCKLLANKKENKVLRVYGSCCLGQLFVLCTEMDPPRNAQLREKKKQSNGLLVFSRTKPSTRVASIFHLFLSPFIFASFSFLPSFLSFSEGKRPTNFQWKDAESWLKRDSSGRAKDNRRDQQSFQPTSSRFVCWFDFRRCCHTLLIEVSVLYTN